MSSLQFRPIENPLRCVFLWGWLLWLATGISLAGGAGAAVLFQELPAPLALADGHFGHALSLDGDVLVVGAPESDLFHPNAGIAVVYHFEGEAWQEITWLEASDGSRADARFGYDVAVSGDWLAVGAPAPGTCQSAVYLFRRVESGWEARQKLNPNPCDGFGQSLAISGNRLVVGVPDFDSPIDAAGAPPDIGAAYVYEFDGVAWAYQRLILPETYQSYGGFGNAVDIDGDFLVVGAPVSDRLGLVDSGEAFLYRFDGDSWISDGALESPAPTAYGGFGFSVAIDSTYGRVHIGEPFYDQPLDDAGAVHSFERIGDESWSLRLSQGSHESKIEGHAGTAVSAKAGILVWGEPGNTDPFFTPRAGRVKRHEYGRLQPQTFRVLSQAGFLPVDHPYLSAADLEMGRDVAAGDRFYAASAAISHPDLMPRIAIFKQTQCSNAVDDDRDGLLDEEDPDCADESDDSEWLLAPDDIVIADNGHPSTLIRIESETGAQTVLSRGHPLRDVYGVEVADDGGLYVSDGSTGSMYRVDERAGEITTVISNAGIYHPRYFSFESEESLVVADSVTDSVHRVFPELGETSPVSTGGNLSIVIDVEVMPSGRLLASDYASAAIVEIDPASGSQTIRSQYGQFSLVWDLAYQDDRHVYLSDVELDALFEVDLETGRQDQIALFEDVRGIDLDNGDGVIVADAGAASIHRVDLTSYARTAVGQYGALDFPMGVAVVPPTYVPEPALPLGAAAGLTLLPALARRRTRRVRRGDR